MLSLSILERPQVVIRERLHGGTTLIEEGEEGLHGIVLGSGEEAALRAQGSPHGHVIPLYSGYVPTRGTVVGLVHGDMREDIEVVDHGVLLCVHR